MVNIVPEAPVKLRLRELRESRFLTQEELAKAAGITVITVSRIERGVAEARLRTVRKLAAALGVEPAELVVRDD